MFTKRISKQLHLDSYFTALIITVEGLNMDLPVTIREGNVSQRGKCGAAEGTGPITEGV